MHNRWQERQEKFFIDRVKFEVPAEDSLELLQEVYEEMRSVQPKGLRYATFQLDDKVTFVSFAEMNEGPEVLQQLEAFQRLRATPGDRFGEPPVLTMLHEVGSYGFR
jgi:hypothetical protein